MGLGENKDISPVALRAPLTLLMKVALGCFSLIFYFSLGNRPCGGFFMKKAVNFSSYFIPVSFDITVH